MTPQNKFKAIVAGVFGGFILLAVVSLMLINSQKPKNTEQVIKNNAELSANIKNSADINLSPNLDLDQRNKTQNYVIQNIDTNSNINNTASTADKPNILNIPNSETNNINTPIISANLLPNLANSPTLQNVNNTNNLNTNHNLDNSVNSNLSSSNTNYETSSANLPAQIVSPESLEIAKLQKRISDLELKIAKQHNINHSNLNRTYKNLHSSKLNAQKQDEKQTILAVVGDRTWIKDNNNDKEHTVAKGEKMQNSSHVKYIDKANDVIIYSSTH